MSDVVGKKDDKGKLRWTLLPLSAVSLVVEVLEWGAAHYGKNNWKNLDDGTTRFIDAAYRHMKARLGGERIDGPTGLPHLACAACSILFALAFDEGTDGAVGPGPVEETTSPREDALGLAVAFALAGYPATVAGPVRLACGGVVYLRPDGWWLDDQGPFRGTAAEIVEAVLPHLQAKSAPPVSHCTECGGLNGTHNEPCRHTQMVAQATALIVACTACGITGPTNTMEAMRLGNEVKFRHATCPRRCIPGVG